MTRPTLGNRVLQVCAAAFWLANAHATGFVVEETIVVEDFDEKIEAAMARPERFAIDVPHVATLDSAGSWEAIGPVSVWSYSVRIPDAVSMSFHAREFRLPAGASLTVTGANGASVRHTSEQVSEQGLWSRTLRGDSLLFELRVATGDRARARFSIASLQAGYRVLGNGGADHPHYRKLNTTAQAVVSAACTRNFSCHETAANANNADATAAIVIGGVALCTATLVNNLRNDGTPYLLTARHCQDTPHSGVVVYWDAVTACGAQLGSVYDTQTPAFLHTANTVFEQQDVWMIRLTSPVNPASPYFAGWDATGSTFVGGYSVHHALGRSRQYTEWFGQAHLMSLPASTLGLGYDSTFWGVVNSTGNVGSGASGGGLFNAEHRLVGVASLAYLEGDGEGVCPAASPPAPDSITATTLYNAFSSVWESNADSTSATNPVTLKSLLDPDNTGLRVSTGFQMLTGVHLRSNNSYSDTGRMVTLTWNGGGATSCTASGGVAGDGWAGARPVNGSFEVTQYEAGITTYSIRCAAGAQFAISSVRVLWNLGPPSLLFSPGGSSGILGNNQRMFWRSTVLPCVATGGSAGDGWAGPKVATGSQDVPLLQPGDISYTLTCGSGPLAATQTYTVRSYAPIATLEPNTTTIRAGNEILVMQAAYGTSCTRTGGAPGDGWTAVDHSYPLRLRTSVPGTYRYTLTCHAGPHGSPAPAEAVMDLTFTNDTPAVSLTASQPSAEISGGILLHTPQFAIRFAWIANVAACQLSYDGPGNNDGNAHPSKDMPARGESEQFQFVPGTYVYRVECGSGAEAVSATATVDYLPNTPRVDVWRDSTLTLARDQSFYIYVDSNLQPCVKGGGSPGDGWAGSTTTPQMISISTPGTFVYTATCGTSPNEVSDSLTVVIPPASLAFEPHPAEVLMNHGVELRWNGTVGNCVFTGDWSSTFPRFATGSAITSSNTPGIKTFGVRCGLSNFIEATTQINFLPVPTVNISANSTTAAVNQPVTLSWTSTHAESCAVEGAGTEDWNGPLPTSGTRSVTRSTPGATGFYINCGGVVDAVVVEWRPVTSSPATPASPAVTFSIDQATRMTGETVTISWTASRAAACRGTLGVTGDGWSGALPVSGSRSFVVNSAGTHTWEISCQGAPPAATARVSATYTSPPAPPAPPPTSGGGGSGSAGGGGGGGGRADVLTLAALASLLMYSFARRRRVLSSPRRD